MIKMTKNQRKLANYQRFMKTDAKALKKIQIVQSGTEKIFALIERGIRVNSK